MSICSFLEFVNLLHGVTNEFSDVSKAMDLKIGRLGCIICWVQSNHTNPEKHRTFKEVWQKRKMKSSEAWERIDQPELEGPNGKPEKKCGQVLGVKTGSQLTVIRELQLQGTKFSQHPKCARSKYFLRASSKECSPAKPWCLSLKPFLFFWGRLP